ncbi:hypothetical protein MMC13_002946 [Lambiella insularis]|nr:hypothetical protein [Lambiella insularis]
MSGTEDETFFDAETGEDAQWVSSADKSLVISLLQKPPKSPVIWFTFGPQKSSLLTIGKERQTQHILLQTWLLENITDKDDIVRSSLSFGPEGSYYARGPKMAKWHAIPRDLEKVILAKRSTNTDNDPARVALGKNGAWIAMWPDGSSTWNLYPALNPYQLEQYFILWQDGTSTSLMAATTFESTKSKWLGYSKNLARDRQAVVSTSAIDKSTGLISPEPVEEQKSGPLYL